VTEELLHGKQQTNGAAYTEQIHRMATVITMDRGKEYQTKRTERTAAIGGHAHQDGVCLQKSIPILLVTETVDASAFPCHLQQNSDVWSVADPPKITTDSPNVE
jgi:hypothetical protein